MSIDCIASTLEVSKQGLKSVKVKMENFERHSCDPKTFR